ncbi:proline-rich proteoglycan 2-like [Colius striatus]|uniref:proline-rich proteoglycan 2-like n=1 Tax=Colius striatus TaxID=57412 RepID=UPI002B1DC44F|nr:proline-rich proteoglycan 2-like [Colius striatus]
MSQAEKWKKFPSEKHHPFKPPITKPSPTSFKGKTREETAGKTLTNHGDTQGWQEARPRRAPGKPHPHNRRLRVHSERPPREQGGQPAASNPGKPYRSGMSPPSTRLGNQPNRLLSPRPRRAGGEARARVAEANCAPRGWPPASAPGASPHPAQHRPSGAARRPQRPTATAVPSAPATPPPRSLTARRRPAAGTARRRDGKRRPRGGRRPAGPPRPQTAPSPAGQRRRPPRAGPAGGLTAAALDAVNKHEH